MGGSTSAAFFQLIHKNSEVGNTFFLYHHDVIVLIIHLQTVYNRLRLLKRMRKKGQSKEVTREDLTFAEDNKLCLITHS